MPIARQTSSGGRAMSMLSLNCGMALLSFLADATPRAGAVKGAEPRLGTSVVRSNTPSYLSRLAQLAGGSKRSRRGARSSRQRALSRSVRAWVSQCTGWSRPPWRPDAIAKAYSHVAMWAFSSAVAWASSASRLSRMGGLPFESAGPDQRPESRMPQPHSVRFGQGSKRGPSPCTHVEVPGGRRSSGSAGLGAVGVCAGAGECTGLDDQVLLADRAAVEPALEDLADSRRVARLGRQRRAGGVRGHAVVGHRPPGMVLRSGLGEPDVARVAGELTALERPHHRVAIADRSCKAR